MCRDADEAMLVAAIQASLVDAGEGSNAPSSQPPATPGKEPTSAREDTPGASASLLKDFPQVSKENSEFVQQASLHTPFAVWRLLRVPQECMLIPAFWMGWVE
jgi:hypothetical protein